MVSISGSNPSSMNPINKPSISKPGTQFKQYQTEEAQNLPTQSFGSEIVILPKHTPPAPLDLDLDADFDGMSVTRPPARYEMLLADYNTPTEYFYVNGIMTEQSEALDAIESLQELLNEEELDIEIKHFNNPSRGGLEDGIEALKNLYRQSTGVGQNFASEIQQILNRDEKVVILAHSQGAAITQSALDLLAKSNDSETMKNISVFTIGGFSVEGQFPPDVSVHTIKHALDFVPKFAWTLTRHEVPMEVEEELAVKAVDKASQELIGKVFGEEVAEVLGKRSTEVIMGVLALAVAAGKGLVESTNHAFEAKAFSYEYNNDLYEGKLLKVPQFLHEKVFGISSPSILIEDHSASVKERYLTYSNGEWHSEDPETGEAMENEIGYLADLAHALKKAENLQLDTLQSAKPISNQEVLSTWMQELYEHSTVQNISLNTTEQLEQSARFHQFLREIETNPLENLPEFDPSLYE